jgi:hypothetical protein
MIQNAIDLMEEAARDKLDSASDFGDAVSARRRLSADCISILRSAGSRQPAAAASRRRCLRGY